MDMHQAKDGERYILREGEALWNLVERTYALMKGEILEHDVLFGQRLGDTLDHGQHAESLAELDAAAEEVLTGSESLEGHELSRGGTQVIRTLVPFVHQIRETIQLLKNLYEGLGRKAEGGGYGVIAYWRDTRRYKRAEQRRMELGKTLNAVWQKYALDKARSTR